MLSISSIWNDKMNIGIEPLDDHHKTIVRLMLEVKAAVDSKKHSDDIRGVLTALISYSKYHFLSEERIMFEKAFPQLEQQRAEHRWFVERLVEITAEYASADAVFKHDLFEHLKGWFANHILVQDMMLRSFMNQEKAEPS
jgi:hemerythrin